MITEKSCLDAIQKMNETRSGTFAEFIAEMFKDQFVEIYVGDAYENVELEQHSQQYPAVFCGKVVGAYKECLVLLAPYVRNKQVQMGNFLFVNERAIRALNQVDGNGTIEDMFFRSKETIEIVKKFG